MRIDRCTVEFATPRGTLRAVDDVSLSLDRGRCLGIVGESGSGKSVLARTVMDLLAANGTRTGTVEINGRDIDTLTRRERRHFWGVEVAMVFQDPMTALNPVRRIGVQLTEALRFHRSLSARRAEERAVELLDSVRVPEARRRLHSHPHELSGGMRQRVMLAMALACDPSVLLADEPTTALDVTVQKAILDLIDELRVERRMAVVLITHDLGVAEGRCDEVAVMYAGRIVERAAATVVFEQTRHPYTRALLVSRPRLDEASHTRLAVIPGAPPDLLAPPPGCSFEPRCGYAGPECAVDAPAWGGMPGLHEFRCRHPVGTERGRAAQEARQALAEPGRAVP